MRAKTSIDTSGAISSLGTYAILEPTYTRPGGGGGGGGDDGGGGTTGGPTSGDDNLTGTTADNTIDGLGGNDTISGLDGNDMLAGNTGADTIDGGNGDDFLYSGLFSPLGSSTPVLDRGSEVDSLTGGDGSDTIFAGYGDNVDGGADGSWGDTLYISFQAATAGIHFDAHLATQTIGGGTITGIEGIGWVEGSNYDDYVDVGTGGLGSSGTQVFGLGGNDTLIAGYSTTRLDGGDGSDILDARNSASVGELDGGAGDDTIYGNSNGLTIANGGDGNDLIYANWEAHGGAGNDTIILEYRGYSHTVTGDAGDDVITGSVDISHDRIEGNDGNDSISGGGGDDAIDGGAGMDTIAGDSGNDTLTGGADNDVFQFGNGDGQDIIADFTSGDVVQVDGYTSAQSITQAGTSVVLVFSSGDQITFQNTDVATVQAGLQFMSATDDTLVGGAGTDDLRGFGGNDTISGGDGNDTLAGGTGADSIEGGGGDDTIYSGDVSPTWNEPYYYIHYTAPLLDTGSEVDTITAGDGDDTIYAGYGDNVDGGANSDFGDELLISFQGGSSGVHFDGDLATQTIGGGTITGIENVSWIVGSNFDDYLAAGTGNGYGKFDVVQGMGGNDTLIAGYFTGILEGGDGNDIVDGRASQYLQEVDGGAGDDTLYTSATGDVIADGGDGNDTIYSNGTTHGGSGNDTIVVGNSSYVNYKSTVSGDAGDDRITGANGADSLHGNDGNDLIDGGGGDDILDGGTGDDVLTGGAGNDRFIAGLGHDVITDFSAGDILAIQSGFTASAITQVGSDVVIALDGGNHLTLQNSDAATVEAALQSSVKLNDIALSSDGATLYGAGDDGNLYIYNAATGEFIRAWHVGTELGGMDISPDGSFAMVTDLQPVTTHADPNGGDPTWTIAAYKVDLSSGAVTTFTSDTQGLDSVFHDAAVLANGDVLLSQEFAGSGQVPTKILDADTGTFTTLDWAGEDTVFSVSESGSYVLAGPQDISDGPLVLYHSGSGVIAKHSLYQDGGSGFNFGVQAIGDNGQLVAQAIYNEGIHIYDGQLQQIVNLGQSHPEWTYGTVSGLAFDPTGKLLFVLDNEADKIVALSTSNWSQVAEFAVGADVSQFDGEFGDRLLVAPDLSYFVVQTDDGGFVKVDAAQTITGTSGNDTLNDPGLSDTIAGLDGNDIINGLIGNDTIDGGAGADTIAGGTGNDILTGGAGNDTFLYSTGDGKDVVTDFAAGDAVAFTGYGSAQSVTQVGTDVVVVLSSGDQITFSNIDAATVKAGLHFDASAGGGGTPGVTLTGTSAANTLTGTAGDDTIKGMAGNDKLSGLGGDDYLLGGSGTDTILGGDGNDRIRGGLGNDVLTGGTGSDVFQFESRNGNDRVTDFQSGVDKLDFHLLGITSSSVTTSLSNGNTLVKIDANHDGRPDFTVALVGVTHVDASDYLFS